MRLQKKKTFKANCYTWDGSIHFPYIIHSRTRENALELLKRRTIKHFWKIENFEEVV